jgi:hypothetical protein
MFTASVRTSANPAYAHRLALPSVAHRELQHCAPLRQVAPGARHTCGRWDTATFTLPDWPPTPSTCTLYCVLGSAEKDTHDVRADRQLLFSATRTRFPRPMPR